MRALEGQLRRTFQGPCQRDRKRSKTMTMTKMDLMTNTRIKLRRGGHLQSSHQDRSNTKEHNRKTMKKMRKTMKVMTILTMIK